ncbi:hypothetical protein KP77_34650 [Jeotgalibacillus alimentarius]|uniref:Uncharacterized protein n=1 Tax=Jeotgalibacillus alimentarius TaxID=135826 RepID=A0A0C2QXQ5_9BACL|nr:hypothetical protein [Jeotgalibacillus alimentarius]KIL42835.1 hypothetical protein KP77_34650 [Jeotgalibacillus alimentarius]
MNKTFHIYGDNIVECSRTLKYIINGFPKNSIKGVSKDLSNISTPRFRINSHLGVFLFIFFPGTNATRWNKDVYKDFVLEAGGAIKEGADALLTEIDENKEVPLLALEFSAALPAGNNTWQRSGRALSLSQAGIPYFYLVHIGGKEYIKETGSLSTRFPNPALSLSFSLNTLTTSVPSLFVYSEAPEADDIHRKNFDACYGTETFSSLLYKLIIDKPIDDELTELYNKNVEFLEKRTALIKKHAFSPKEYSSILKSEDPYETLRTLTRNKKIKWNKKLASKIRLNFNGSSSHPMLRLLKDLEDHSYALLTKDIPCTFVPAENRKKLADHVCNNLYKNKITEDFKKWIYKEEDLVVCVINGFKPKGDDSRPDRGLAPLSKMLLNNDLLTIVIGTAKPEVWTNLDKSPPLLLRNGLWQSIFHFSDGILVDTPTRIGYEKNTYYKNHWTEHLKKPSKSKETILNIKDFPIKVGEHDVDTAIHILFSYVGQHFECVCNPPGGDWSGISLLKRGVEYRWTSMNRVSKENTKRPDHIYQMIYNKKPTLLLIESKGVKSELYKHKEENVGTGMVKYLENLLNREYTASKSEDYKWKASSGNLSLDYFKTYTAVAYLLKQPLKNEIEDVKNLLEFSQSQLIFILDLKVKKSVIHIFSIEKDAYEYGCYLAQTLNNAEVEIIVHKP